jgi:outer membrane receptor protein involved in Fe transport
MIVDLWGFEHTNKIDSLTSSYILRNADALSAAAGRPIVNRQAPSARDVAVGAPGALRGFGSDTGTAYFSSYFNAQKQLTNGIDVELRYRNIQTDLGRLGLQTTVTKVNSFKRQTSPGGALVQYNDSWGYPTTRASSVATLDNGDFRYTLVNNYVSSYGQYYGVGPQRVGRTSTFDAQVQYNGIKDTRISFGGRNITNKKPSWADVDWYGYDSSNYDPRGAFWYLKVNRTFK